MKFSLKSKLFRVRFWRQKMPRQLSLKMWLWLKNDWCLTFLQNLRRLQECELNFWRACINVEQSDWMLLSKDNWFWSSVKRYKKIIPDLDFFKIPNFSKFPFFKIPIFSKFHFFQCSYFRIPNAFSAAVMVSFFDFSRFAQLLHFMQCQRFTQFFALLRFPAIFVWSAIFGLSAILRFPHFFRFPYFFVFRNFFVFHNFPTFL